MRGSDRRSGELFSYVDVATRIPGGHPLRTIRAVVDEALERLTAEFYALYARRRGRPSIPPEMLLRAMLLQAFYSIRSERQLMERLEFDLLFRWFVGLSADEPAWDHSSFSKNRDRLLDGEIAARFLSVVLARPRVKRLLSTQHFSADGTSKPGRASSRLSLRTIRRRLTAAIRLRAGHRATQVARRAATPMSTSRGRSARTRRIVRPPTRRRCSTAKGLAWRRSSASSATG
jgi:transposase